MKSLLTILLGIGMFLNALPLRAQPTTPANSVVGYPGAGVLQAGDVWESFLPQGFTPCYSEANTAATYGTRTFLRMGNFDRQWTTPATHWPAAYPVTPYWYKNAMVLVYDRDPTFNPATIGGAANPSYFAGSRNTANAYSEFAQLTYKSSLQGAAAPARKYSAEPYWVDGIRRQHVVYEAAWPTNLGIDVKLRAHAFQGPNWNNLNDYVIVEIELKNTGVLDMNMDGVAEKIGNDIKALAFQVSGEAYMSISSYAGGGRNLNDIVPTIIARQACWIDDVDENGEPWAFTFYRTAPTTTNPTTGYWDFGFNGGASKNYTDVYTGWVMIDAKVGGLPTDASKSTSTLPTKSTIFGTHPIGISAQRGWFVSGQANSYVHYTDDPRRMFYATTAAFYSDCGRSLATPFTAYNLGPNVAGFTGGTFGDPTTFLAKPQPWTSRPNGSMQSAGAFDQVSTEDGKADATTNYPNGFGKFSQGASHTENFNGDSYSGIGPFSLKKDSVMTLVFATVAGYRLEGIQKAVRAARWAYTQNFVIPKPPPLPDMGVFGKLDGSFSIEWDMRAEADAEFAGYKIWRALQSDTTSFLNEGMRIVDRYQEQMTAGARPDPVYKPVNPKFDGFAKTLSTTLKGNYQPDTWGTWKLLKSIPKADLGGLSPGTVAGYDYSWVDSSVAPGTYWYYVSAFKAGTYTGPGGEQTDRLETHYTNRNGASGLWKGTFPFGFNNVNFPKTVQGRKDIGASVTRSRLIAYRSLSFGSVNLGGSRDLEIWLRNSSDFATDVHVASNNQAFSLSRPSFSIPARDSLTMSVRFTPSHFGLDSGKCLIGLSGLPNVDSLSLTGNCTAGNQSPALAWQNTDESTPLNISSPFVSIDKSGSVYSAVMRYGNSGNGGVWTVRKHGALGGATWSCSDTCFAPLPQISGYVVDGFGNSYVAFNGVAVPPPSGGAMGVTKISPEGQLLWNQAVTLPFDRGMVCSKLAVDQTGNTYVTGYSYSQSAGSNTRITTAKFNPGGSLEWVTHHEGLIKMTDSTDFGKSIAVDSLGNVYVTGQTGGNLLGDIVTLKYNPAGVMQWFAYYNGPSDSADTGVDIAVGSTGEVYVLGTSAGIGTGIDIVLLKYQATDGALLWSNRFDGPAHGHDYGGSVQTVRQGKIVVAGTVANGTSNDGILLRYTPENAREVLLQYDGATGSYDALGIVREDADGYIYAAGNSIGALGYNEAVLLKFDATGVIAWEGHYVAGYDGSTTLSSLAVGNSGVVAIGGSAVVKSAPYKFFVAAFGSTILSVPAASTSVSVSYSLEQNYPNPFNPSTIITFDIPVRSPVILTVYNTLGQVVREMIKEERPAGHHEVRFDASGLATGVYFYRLRAGEFVETKRLLLLK